MNYEEMTVNQLKEEIKRRNQEETMFFAYSDKRKADLILALQRNDSGETQLDRIRRAYYSEKEIKKLKGGNTR